MWRRKNVEMVEVWIECGQRRSFYGERERERERLKGSEF